MGSGEPREATRLRRNQESPLAGESNSLTRLVAFLRGINVGGHIVKKEKLLESFTALGFLNVTTYRQSGNVIFETEIPDLSEVETRIEDKLRGALGYDVPVFIRKVEYLRSLVKRNRIKVEGEGTSLMVTLLPGPASDSALSLPLTIPKSKAEIVSASGSEVFSLTHGGGEGGLPNPFLESRLKVKATTRNMNVIKEIVENCGQDSDRTP